VPDFNQIRPILEYGVAVLVAVAVAVFAWKLDREYHDDLRKQRDTQTEIVRAQAAAIERLAERIDAVLDSQRSRATR
jgi:hypothetical protein